MNPTSQAAAVSRWLSVERLLDRFYPLQTDGNRYRDHTSPFYDRMIGSLAPEASVLNVGAGAVSTEPSRRVRRAVGRLTGVDIDAAVLTNPDLDQACVTDGVRLPYEDDAFDAVYSDWTMEHVEHPELLLNEIHRVLKPGCSYWFRTTSLRHYVTSISAATPLRLHTWLLSAIGAKPEGGPWRTYYRANTPSRIRRLLERAGYRDCEVLMVETCPWYLTFNPIAFLLGVVYERTVNSTHWLCGFRLVLIARATKGMAAEAP